MIDSQASGVLIHPKGNVFNGVGEKKHFDVLIYHPRTKYINNRPDWLVNSSGVQFVKIDRSKMKKDQYPILVEAIPEGEKNSVPVDVVEIKSNDEPTELLLNEGKYNIIITDKNKSQIEYPLIVPKIKSTLKN